MLVIFKISAVLNVVALNLSPHRVERDPEDIGRMCHSFEIFCCLLLQGGNFLGNGDSMFLYEAFVPMYQITRRHIPKECIVNNN